MKISFIGAGRAGAALGRFFFRRGAAIAGFYSRSGAKAAAAATGGRVFATLKEAADSGDIIILSVPDGEIAAMAERIAREAGQISGKTFVHLSGAHSSGLLAPLRERGAGIASLHPPFTFAAEGDEPGDIIFALEGEGVCNLKAFLDTAGLRYIEIGGADKALYHAAAVMASNYITALLSYSFELLESSGIGGDAAQKIFEGLSLAAVKNTFSLGPAAAMTGPAARGDLETIRAHLTALRNKGEILKLYKILGRRAAEIAGAPDNIKEEFK